MNTIQQDVKNNVTIVKEFFGSDGYPPVTAQELIALKKEYPNAVQEFADAIRALKQAA